MAVYHAIRRLALPVSVSAWVSVRCPIATSSVLIENTSQSAIYVRTEANADYYKRIPANAEYPIRCAALTWDQDDEVCQLQAPSADAVAVVSFSR